MEGLPIRFSTGQFPKTKANQDKTKVPTSIVFTPIVNENVYECQLTPCSKCGAFPSPLINGQIQDRCVFCGNNVQLPNYQIQNNHEWTITSQVNPKTVFVIDGSYTSKSSGFLDVVLKSISSSYPKTATNVAFMTVSDVITFLMPNSRVGVLADLNDAVIPPSAFLKEFPETLEPLSKVKVSDKGPDIYSILEIISKQIGQCGHIYLFLSNPPKGDVTFSNVSIETENASLRGANYSEKFETIVKRLDAQCAYFDVLVNALVHRLIDCGTFGKMCSKLGGRIQYTFKLPNWRLQNIIENFLQCCDSVCSLRVSGGAQILPSLGQYNHHPHSFKLSLPQSHIFPLILPQVINEERIFVQAVIKFRTNSGVYKQRVYTYSAGVTEDNALIFKEADCSVILKYVTSSLLGLFFNENVMIKQLKDYALGFLKPIFFSYRYHISRNPNRFMNLVMPKSLQMLPKYVLGILKNTAFSGSIVFDERATQLIQLIYKTPEELIKVAYPEFFEITDYLDTNGELVPLNLTENECKSDRILFLFDGFNSFIWLGAKINSDVCNRTFGKPTPYSFDEIKLIDTEESRRLFSLIKGNMRFFFEPKTNGPLFSDRLIEDHSSTLQSYPAWLNSLHVISLPKDGH
ncbi:Sec23/Sec24 zinc finger family protein [Tritrichomonas foetus]|uniref:Sec23/Sec24 zinc finger family protein n=1 Tax=Tritrichomonas foetus TaxID=1144522 RepID=A0A1J4KFH8_9EUKA|nr:Sec23/Sec24 zinc finger family protein [Tritrichomonas foetus]|eukprot:OHT09680.1 Sec23/Sec24 zinc finger family protein [Tritrichomonas foetus]